MPGMNEADTCRVMITPALRKAGWGEPVWRLAEQRRIVSRIEALTRREEEVRKELAQADAHLAAFTPALLAKAFRGEL